MKRSLLSIFFLYILIPVGIHSAHAAEYNTFSLSPEVSYIKYREPDVMREKGTMYGIGGSYTYHNDNFLVRQEGRFSYGEVDYKNSGTLDNIRDYIVEARALAGYDVLTSTDILITPYIGIGYRYLNDGGSDKTTSDGSQFYDRESNYLYTPMGIELTKQLDSKWTFGAVFEYDLFWRGWQKSHLSDVEAGYGLHYDDLENTQKSGYGLRGSLKFIRSYDMVDLIIEPFMRYWKIGESDDKNLTIAGIVVGHGYEPKNNSTEGGLMVTCRWGSGRDRLRIRDFKRPITQTMVVAPAPVVAAVPKPKTPVSIDAYYENIRRDIVMAVSDIKTEEKGHARVNVAISYEGNILSISIINEETTLSDSLRAEIINSISAAAPFEKFPPFITNPQISFSVPIIFQ